jgi:hypothetical protein
MAHGAYHDGRHRVRSGLSEGEGPFGFTNARSWNPGYRLGIDLPVERSPRLGYALYMTLRPSAEGRDGFPQGTPQWG